MADIEHPPVEPISELDDWATQLQRIAEHPLEFCPDFPRIARRFEAWWHQAIEDRPIFVGVANTNPDRPVNRRLDLLDKPDQWLDAKILDMKQEHRAGDALPNVRVDFGPVFIGALVGGETEYGANTSWTHPCISDDWSDAPQWKIDPDNKQWNQFKHLMDITAQAAAGKFLVATPDLGGSADALTNLRGATEICMDVIEQPDQFKQAIEALYDVWRQAFIKLYQIPLPHGAGVIHWHLIWAQVPYFIPACDLNFMIGPDEFNELCLPDIAQQCATVKRAVFHLDGPGAARHIDALLEVPELQAIQFTPGEGTPSALAWVDMYKKIQAKGRSVWTICPIDEVVELSQQLKPEGLGLWAHGAKSPEHVDAVFSEFAKRFGSAG